MNSRLYIPALITLGLGILSGCGGSSSSEQAYLPTGLQRTLDITLQDGAAISFLWAATGFLLADRFRKMAGVQGKK